MKAFAVSDKGKVRPTNQDSYAINIDEENEIYTIIVCDGMGGANAGNVASKFACQVFIDEIKAGLSKKLLKDEIKMLMKECLEKANSTIYNLAKQQKEFRGMGTTFVAAICKKEYQIIANVGDSRAYVINENKIEQITFDHSYIEEMVREGKLSRDEADTHPAKNLITRAVGVDREVKADYFDISICDTDKILLCSDGLSGLLDEEEIKDTVVSVGEIDKASKILVEKALENGGFDNITALLFTL